jgi:hypothetical protein
MSAHGVGDDEAFWTKVREGFDLPTGVINLDNNWDSHFFVCENYKPIKNEYKPGDDDWACDWIEDFAFGRFKPYGDLYLPEFGETEVSRGVKIFLIARTVAAFGRCSDKYASETLALCMGFHDQDPIVRVN